MDGKLYLSCYERIKIGYIGDYYIRVNTEIAVHILGGYSKYQSWTKTLLSMDNMYYNNLFNYTEKEKLCVFYAEFPLFYFSLSWKGSPFPILSKKYKTHSGIKLLFLFMKKTCTRWDRKHLPFWNTANDWNFESNFTWKCDIYYSHVV